MYLGLMSGTSLDGLDMCLVDFHTSGSFNINCFCCIDYPKEIKNKLHIACDTSNNDVNFLQSFNIELAKFHADAVNKFLKDNNLAPADIKAIGSIGQTIRHEPNIDFNFSYQIIEPNTLAVSTGINVIADFRQKDIACGGQGAPLSPVFHKYILDSLNLKDEHLFIVNIGGIANLSYLHKDKLIGFDCSTGNLLLNTWCRKHLDVDYDKDGNFAAQGSVNHKLLDSMFSDPFFAESYPKSTGRDLFNMQWLESHLAKVDPVAPADVQATLVALTARGIISEITNLADRGKVYICGGGAYNLFLYKTLVAGLSGFEVDTTAALGVAPDQVEAAMIGWLSYMYENNYQIDLRGVTGSNKICKLGVKYNFD